MTAGGCPRFMERDAGASSEGLGRRLQDGTIHTAEVHSYEAHVIGRKEFKLKLPLLD